MRLPNADRAFADICKLRDYCLNPEHPEGRHKARVFRASLGMTAADAEALQVALLDAARDAVADKVGEDSYGCRYTIDLSVKYGGRVAMLRSGWIIKHGEDFPRLTTCFVL